MVRCGEEVGMSAERVHELLDQHGVAYDVHAHERVVDANRLAEREDVSGWQVAKPVLLSVGGQLAMVVVSASVQVDLDKASDVLGHNEVRLATEDEFASLFPDSEIGAEPPFGNVYGLPVFLDEKLRAQSHIVCRDGSHTDALHLSMEDYLRVVGPEIVDVSTSAG
jgi:Ala-tRNA(Pro) deacylase